MEFGCNDGVFLKPAAELGFEVVGVDPATNVVQTLINEGFYIINEFFNEQIARLEMETCFYLFVPILILTFEKKYSYCI